MRGCTGQQTVGEVARGIGQRYGVAAAVDLGRLADVYLFVTNVCNLRCTHCYVSSG